jgi:Transposase, Mutator family
VGWLTIRRRLVSELARLGARLIIRRAVEEEFDTWLVRARYERRPEAGPGKRNGFRSRQVQTAEGELRIPQAGARSTCSSANASNDATFTDLDGKHLYRIKYQPAEPQTGQAGDSRLSPQPANQLRPATAAKAGTASDASFPSEGHIRRGGATTPA